MTLLVAWRSTRGIHMVSDTRLTFGEQYVDLGIKIMSAPYRIYGPGQKTLDNVMADGDLGLGFAGSAVAALTLAATLRDILTTMQGAPGYTDAGMDGIIDLLWRAYDQQQKALCEVLFEKGLAAVMVAGFCMRRRLHRAFLFEVETSFQRSCREILQNVDDVEIIGSGAPTARALIQTPPTQKGVLAAVQAVIDDAAVPTVGGPMQFGELIRSEFRTLGVARLGDRKVHHWRGGLDLNAQDLTRDSGLILGYPLLDLIGQ